MQHLRAFCFRGGGSRASLVQLENVATRLRLVIDNQLKDRGRGNLDSMHGRNKASSSRSYLDDYINSALLGPRKADSQVSLERSGDKQDSPRSGIERVMYIPHYEV